MLPVSMVWMFLEKNTGRNILHSRVLNKLIHNLYLFPLLSVVVLVYSFFSFLLLAEGPVGVEAMERIF